jgi:2-amino-4-hydroxy-6-hydroxymethyldihydropteridine diphosphokinase
MILLALGANLPSERFGPPRETLEAGLGLLSERGVRVADRASWFESAPLPAADQPWFLNTVVRVETALPPGPLLDTLHAVEAALGRVRSVPNAPRAADFDLLDVDGRITGPHDWPRLPHPRMHQRAFVLMPLAELAPDWRHPVFGRGAAALLAALPADQICRPVDARPRGP